MSDLLIENVPMLLDAGFNSLSYRFLNYYKDPSSKTGLREKWANPERFRKENEYQAWYRANRRKH